MSMFTLVISTSNLPWFMDLTLQVPMQYALYSIGLYFHHQSHPQLGAVFCFGSISSFFLKLSLLWSPVAYWAPNDLRSYLSESYLFAFSYCLLGFSRQEYWSSLSFPSPVDHILSELSTMTRLSCVTLYGMAHSFIELDKAVVQVIRLVSFMWLWFSVCLPSDGEG